MTSNIRGYYVAGGRTGVLLMHGLCGTPTEMRFVANGLARTGCTVYCPMLAGHGGNKEDIKHTTWQDWYRSAETALDRLREDCDTVIVGGLSTGALLALMLAARRPADVQATALMAPTLWLNGWLIPWYARLFRLVFSKRVANLIDFPDLHPHGIKDERIREFIRNALFSGDGSVAGLPSTPGVLFSNIVASCAPRATSSIGSSNRLRSYIRATTITRISTTPGTSSAT